MRQDLRTRTRRFSVQIIKFIDTLPHSTAGSVIGRQLLRSATSVGAHYHEAFRSRSTSEFISKLETALQELDETSYWLLLVVDAGLVEEAAIEALLEETNQLTAMFVTSVKNLKSRKKANRV